MSKPIELEQFIFSTEYTIGSSLGEMENARYFQKIEGKIFAEDTSEGIIKVVGRLSGLKLLLGEGISDGWDAFSTMNRVH